MGNCLNKKKTDLIIEQGKTEYKLLLLGAGDSGKTTIYKQIKLFLDDGFTEDEKKSYIPTIRNNMILGMKSLVLALDLFDLKFEQEDLRKLVEKFRNIEIDALQEDSIYTEEIGEEILKLWVQEQIQICFERRATFQVIENFDYFMKEIERIGKSNYLPSENDILRCRSKSLGIIETRFKYDGTIFRLVDVGGQRTERKKWIHCFEGVSGVLFVAALSEYDQTCYEDNTTSRMQESLKLFNEICAVKFFNSSIIFLLLNKEDLFQEKVKKVDPKVCFSDYTGGCNSRNALEYIQEEFLKRNEDQKSVITRIIIATDTENIKMTFQKICSAIKQK